jgi:hypothetical protein
MARAETLARTALVGNSACKAAVAAELRMRNAAGAEHNAVAGVRNAAGAADAAGNSYE